MSLEELVTGKRLPIQLIYEKYEWLIIFTRLGQWFVKFLILINGFTPMSLSFFILLFLTFLR